MFFKSHTNKSFLIQLITVECAPRMVLIRTFLNHSKLFAEQRNHINGIENFWNQAKQHMRKFNGVPRVQFPLCLKECEWRFNNPKPKEQLTQLKQWVKVNMA